MFDVVDAFAFILFALDEVLNAAAVILTGQMSYILEFLNVNIFKFR